MDEWTRTAAVNVLGLRYEFALGKWGGGEPFFFVCMRFVFHCPRRNHIFAPKCTSVCSTCRQA